MNQKWQKLLTTALCCSLLISSLNGISVLAETMVVENETTTETGETTASEDTATSDSSLNASQENETANTVASSETTTEPETSELPQKMIEEPQLPSAEDQTEATADTTTAAVEATQEEPTKRENRAVKTADIPEKTYKMAFIDENGLFIDPAKVTFTADVTKVERKSGTQTKVGTITTSNLGNFKMLTVPKVTLPDDDATEDYGFSGLTNHKITLPGQYTAPKTTPNNFYKGPDTTTFPLAVSRQVTIATGKDYSTYTTGERFNMFTTSTPKQFNLRTYSWVPDPQKVQFSAAYNMATTAGENNYLITDDTIYYYVPNRRVSIYYNDMTSTVLPTYPTGYNAALSKTVVESDNFHYKAPKAFPKTYSSGNRHFQFKGWYKGSARPDPKAVKLETTLTPEFDVTYDGKDNVYVFYEELEEKTTTIPEITYSFGFVDEKGALIAPANFGMQTNLTSIMNGIAKQVGTATGVNSGNLKKLTIPSQQLTYTKTINPAFYGSTNFRLTIPKQYKPPTVTPGPHYTGSSTAYPVATKRMRFVDSTIADIRVETDGKYYSLYPTTTANQYRLYYTSWIEDTTKTRFDSILTSTNTEVSVPNYYTTDDTMYYFLENRRITENFVDENGTKITAPTGFTQGKQTVIDSDTYHFKLAQELPYSYYANDKAYRFKGWYKGKTQPQNLQTTRVPEYDASYDDNDDLTIIYEEIKYGGNTVQFGFVGESGQLLNPADFKVTTEVVQIIDGVSTVLDNISATDQTGNLKAMTIPQKQYTLTNSSNFYGTRNSFIEIPKYYKNLSFQKPSGYQGQEYPLAGRVERTFAGNPYTEGANPVYFTVTKSQNQRYKLREIYWDDNPENLFSSLYKTTLIRNDNSLAGVEMFPESTLYYYLVNRRVTENFVDASGTKITPPTGFTQGKQTIIDKDNFTFTQAGTLPFMYKVNNRPYVLKGWYKGKEKPDKLNEITRTNRNISYPVTYDDQDDITIVYDEFKTEDKTINFGFINETGDYVAPSNFNIRTDMSQVVGGLQSKLQTITALPTGDFLQLKLPAVNIVGSFTSDEELYGTRNSIVTIPKYYKTPTITPSSKYNGPNYSGVTGIIAYHNTKNSAEFTENRLQVTPISGSQTDYRFPEVGWQGEPTRTTFSSLYKMDYNSTVSGVTAHTEIYATGTVNYYLENRRITENFVDENGTKITAPTGFTQGNQLVMNSETYKYTAAKALPKTYQVGEKTYVFKGWYKGKETTTPLKTTTTPSFTPTFDENDDMTAVYQEAVPTAELTVKGSADIVENGATMDHWEVLLKNTGEAPLTTIKIKPTATWAAGISPPNTIFVLGTGQNAKAYPVTKEQWAAGFSLPLNTPLPAGGQLQMNLLGTAVTGNPGQVLTAEVEVTGNFGSLIAKDTVRIKDLDQEITNPDGDGFISTPTFDFGKLAISGSKQQYGLKKAADYYDNGTRNPYLRLNTSQDNWSLTAQLSQPKSATDRLPTTTRLLLGTAAAASFTDYNQPTETKTPLGKTGTVNLTADNTATAVVANQQFTGSDVYQLDFTFANIKLEVPANQGMSGQQYQAAVTWNLVTGP